MYSKLVTETCFHVCVHFPAATTDDVNNQSGTSGSYAILLGCIFQKRYNTGSL